MEDTPVIQILEATTCDCCCRRGIYTKVVGIQWKENVDSQHSYIDIYLCDDCIEHEHTPLIGQNTLQMCPILRQNMLFQSLSQEKTAEEEEEEEITTVIDDEETAVIDEEQAAVIDEEQAAVIDEEQAAVEDLLAYSF